MINLNLMENPFQPCSNCMKPMRVVQISILQQKCCILQKLFCTLSRNWKNETLFVQIGLSKIDKSNFAYFHINWTYKWKLNNRSNISQMVRRMTMREIQLFLKQKKAEIYFTKCKFQIIMKEEMCRIRYIHCVNYTAKIY